jgi:hypothetical protein
MVLHKAHLGEPEVDLSPVFGSDAISLVYRLTRMSYALAGQPLPTYRREQIPCKFIRWPAR